MSDLETPNTEEFTLETTEEAVPPEENLPNELALLKERAIVMGIKFHPSIGVDTLRDKVNAAIIPAAPKPDNRSKAEKKAESIAARNASKRKEATRLVRFRLTCMDPNKKGWPGEVFTVSNAVIGTVRKFIPFHAEDGFHAERIIFKQLQAKKHQEFRKVKLSNGRSMMQGYLAKTFAIEKLDDLSVDELKTLADRQALNHSIDQ